MVKNCGGERERYTISESFKLAEICGQCSALRENYKNECVAEGIRNEGHNAQIKRTRNLASDCHRRGV